MPADMPTGARHIFDGLPAAVDDDTTNRLLENMIFEDQISLDGFPLDHGFPEDYDLEEDDDDIDIDWEPLFEEDLANQTDVGAKLKRKSKLTKAYTSTEDKLLCGCWRDIGDYHQREGEVQGTICRPLDAWGKEVVQDHSDGEKARRGGRPT
ncbi:Helicase SKI2W [Hordeum vulgare]|nr:Helicase SKI2W [Hordeum vulgare]